MRTISRIDWDIVDARVKSTQQRMGLGSTSIAFIWLVLEQFFPGNENDLQSSITDGGEDQVIDAIHIIEKEDYADIYLFQSKYRTSQSSTNRTINDGEILKIGLFINRLFEKDQALHQTGNFNLNQCVLRIYELYSRGVICRYRIVICSNDQGLSPSAKDIIDTILKAHGQISYERYDHTSLIRYLSSGQLPKESGFLQVISREVFERTDGDIRGAIASIDANSFLDLICTDGRQSLKRFLFDDNLRIYLGSSGGFNSEIISTASSTDSHLFWYLNNGITITCRNYSYNKGLINPKIYLENFSIVNGAQTSNSLFEASKYRPDSIENVVLLVRICATDRADITEKVAVATNSQAKIQLRDLRSNRPVLKKFETAFLAKGYFFERKRNMHLDKPADRRIDALKLGQIIMSFYLKDPDKARTDSDSIFEARFDQIFNESYSVDELCSLVSLYGYIEKIKERSGQIEPSGSVKNENLDYLTYGHWHVLYACSLMLAQDDRDIPDGEEAERLIIEAINIVSQACKSQASTSHYQLFRSPKTKVKIYQEIAGPQQNLFDYFDLIDVT